MIFAISDLLLKYFVLFFRIFSFLFLGGFVFYPSSSFCKKTWVKIQVDCSAMFAETIQLLLFFSLKKISKDDRALDLHAGGTFFCRDNKIVFLFFSFLSCIFCLLVLNFCENRIVLTALKLSYSF